MYLATEGRKDYLDFVKNIPIQAFFFFLGALLFHGGASGHPTVAKNVAGADFLAKVLQFSRRWWVRKRAFAEVFIVILVIDVAFSAATISGLFSAFNALRINLG